MIVVAVLTGSLRVRLGVSCELATGRVGTTDT